jgi:hypothetical protein
MIVEDQLDRGASRIGGIEELEEFDELSAAMAVARSLSAEPDKLDCGALIILGHSLRYIGSMDSQPFAVHFCRI